MFLPLTKKELAQRDWTEVDFLCVTGDAYVDHPSFGIAIVSRLLESLGFRVAMIAQPVSDQDFTRFGAPKYGFFVNGGNIDSMVSHYTVAKRRRGEDAYSPGGKAGARPDRAVTAYSRRLRALYPDTPIIIGGLEASMRRFAHYDYWNDSVMPSVLLESQADLLIYGMGEKQTAHIARALADGTPVKEIRCRGICYLTDSLHLPENAVSIASYAKVRDDKTAYARAMGTQMTEQDAVRGHQIIQKHDYDLFLVQTEPMPALETAELDEVFALPFERMYHPSYEARGGVPAIEEIEFSIMQNRGCFGACNFCSIAFHQGSRVTCRSIESILNEARAFTKNPRFKGIISDVGGPSANFRLPSCEKQLTRGSCANRKCLAPTPCPNLQVDHTDYMNLLRELRRIPGVRKVFVRSGLRFDYMMCEKDDTFMRELLTHHVSGQLKVAPEHCSAHVLDCMGKPHIGVYERFSERFYRLTKAVGKEQYLVPYFISSHPGSTLRDAVQLALFMQRNRIRPEQVQDFYPTPGTVATCMFYTGLDPMTMKEVYVPRSQEDKWLQRALLQYHKPENRRAVLTALERAGRTDLINALTGTEKKPGGAQARSGAQERPTAGAGKKPGGAQARSGGQGRPAAGAEKKPGSAQVRSGGQGRPTAGAGKKPGGAQARSGGQGRPAAGAGKKPGGAQARSGGQGRPVAGAEKKPAAAQGRSTERPGKRGADAGDQKRRRDRG